MIPGLFPFVCVKKKKMQITKSFECTVKPLLCTSYSVVRFFFLFRNLACGLIARPFKFFFLVFWSQMVIQSRWRCRTELFPRLAFSIDREKRFATLYMQLSVEGSTRRCSWEDVQMAVLYSTELWTVLSFGQHWARLQSKWTQPLGCFDLSG